MKFAVGVMVAPRPCRTIETALAGLRRNGLEPVCFVEPGVPCPEGAHCVQRPATASETSLYLPEQLSSKGGFGNFQNYTQMMADLLAMYPHADALLLCEDDARFCEHLMPFLRTVLWPHRKCGAVSLYAPNMRDYSAPFPMCKHILRINTVGALAIVFRPEVARAMLDHPMTKAWKGDKRQQHGVPSWERRGCDAWVGNCLSQAKYDMYAFSPSLVEHNCPPEASGMNSSLGNGTARGPRMALDYIGDKADPFKVFKGWLDISFS